MDISIIMATLNEEKYLPRTLESLKKQKTNKKYEIVLGDGKSTDKTIKIAKKYGCKIATVEPGIIAVGRQAAAEAATGKILVTANADTVYSPTWLEEMTKPIKGNVVGSFGKLLPLDGNKTEELFAKTILHHLTTVTYKIKMPYAGAESMAMSKKAFDKVGGFDITLITAEDTELMKRLSKVGKVVYCPKAICYTSMRRVRKWGYAKYLMFHTKNFIRIQTTGKAHNKYEAIR